MSNSKNQKNAQTTVFDSIAAAAAGLNVTVAILRKVKKMGAPGFRGSRIYATELLPWLTEHLKKIQGDGQSKEALEIRKLTGQCERIEFENNVARNKFYSKSEVNQTVKNIGERQKTMLFSKCRNELAQRLEGLTAIQRIEALEQFATEICEIFNNGLAKYQQ